MIDLIVVLSKKGRAFLPLPFFVFIAISCSNKIEGYGSITTHSISDRNSFIFSVKESFLLANLNSRIDEENYGITYAEISLLKKLLKSKEYCLDKQKKPSFKITSRQEKIYDATFAHLIEENYNARPISPRMYFGQCVE